jgi:hypothetical protein
MAWLCVGDEIVGRGIDLVDAAVLYKKAQFSRSYETGFVYLHEPITTILIVVAVSQETLKVNESSVKIQAQDPPSFRTTYSGLEGTRRSTTKYALMICCRVWREEVDIEPSNVTDIGR